MYQKHKVTISNVNDNHIQSAVCQKFKIIYNIIVDSDSFTNSETNTLVLLIRLFQIIFLKMVI